MQVVEMEQRKLHQSTSTLSFAISEELRLPVKLVGLGEGLDDLQPFDPRTFAEALFAPAEA